MRSSAAEKLSERNERNWVILVEQLYNGVRTFKTRDDWEAVEGLRMSVRRSSADRGRADRSSASSSMGGSRSVRRSLLSSASSRYGGRHGRIAQCIVVEPSSPFRVVWCFLSLSALALDFIILSAELFVDNIANESSLRILMWMAQGFWIVDTMMGFSTAVYVNGELNKDLLVIARVYGMTWFPFDFFCTGVSLAALILDSVVTDQKYMSANLVRPLKMLRFMRYIRVVRMLKTKQIIEDLLDRINSIVVTAVVYTTNNILALILWVHVCGCVWFAVGSSASTGGWVVQHGFDHAPPALQYVASIQWAAAQLQGSTGITSSNVVVYERIISVITILGSALALSMFVSKLTNLMADLQKMSNTQMVTQMVTKFLHEHNINQALSLEVKRYLASRRDRAQQQENADQVLELLPVNLKRSIVSSIRTPYLTANPLFVAMEDVNSRCLERIVCDGLQSSLVAPSTIIFGQRETCASTYFINIERCMT